RSRVGMGAGFCIIAEFAFENDRSGTAEQGAKQTTDFAAAGKREVKEENDMKALLLSLTICLATMPLPVMAQGESSANAGEPAAPTVSSPPPASSSVIAPGPATVPSTGAEMPASAASIGAPSLLAPSATRGSADASAASGDVIFEAMNDELARSMKLLKIEKHEKPYYISYRIDDDDYLYLTATFGAISKEQSPRHRTLTVDVHVGDYHLDSGNSGHMGGWEDFFDSSKMSLDDNYDAIRYRLWLRTDSQYKHAIAGLESKKANLQQRIIKDRPDDWSKETPLVFIQPRGKLVADREQLKARIKKFSSIFKDYPKIRESTVSLRTGISNRYFVDNEGSKSRVFESYCSIHANATAQAADGMTIKDSMLISALDPAHLPKDDEIAAQIRSFAKNLTKSVEAKDAEQYEGPVLFEGDAAASLFSQYLSNSLCARKPSDSAHSYEDVAQSRVGRRILPSSVSVVDEPHYRDAKGNLTVASYNVDTEGVAAQRVVLVEKGILKTLLSNRQPTQKVKSSNGHAFEGGRPRISNLVIQSSAAIDKDALKAKLIAMGKEDGLDYVLIVRRLNWPHGSQFVDASYVYVSDGHEERVRGAELPMITMSTFRDIAAIGNDVSPHPIIEGSANLITPSVILRDVEIQKPRSTNEKLPTLPHPYFEK
ncbi:MAG TPA: metallopeptidase TldD-related protein, partial [Chroococcales cyanobacterium]